MDSNTKSARTNYKILGKIYQVREGLEVKDLLSNTSKCDQVAWKSFSSVGFAVLTLFCSAKYAKMS